METRKTTQKMTLEMNNYKKTQAPKINTLKILTTIITAITTVKTELIFTKRKRKKLSIRD